MFNTWQVVYHIRCLTILNDILYYCYRLKQREREGKTSTSGYWPSNKSHSLQSNQLSLDWTQIQFDFPSNLIHNNLSLLIKISHWYWWCPRSGESITDIVVKLLLLLDHPPKRKFNQFNVISIIIWTSGQLWLPSVSSVRTNQETESQEESETSKAHSLRHHFSQSSCSIILLLLLTMPPSNWWTLFAAASWVRNKL